MTNKKNDSSHIEADWIRELVSILNETGLTEIEIEKSNIRLRVSRAASTLTQAVAPAVAPVAVAAPAVAPAADAPAPAASHTNAVTSPMVGTVYLASSPDSDPFVKIGDQVSEGQTLMIIEAMKTMNPISAPRGGQVKKILIQDAAPVEFGEPLIVIE